MDIGDRKGSHFVDHSLKLVRKYLVTLFKAQRNSGKAKTEKENINSIEKIMLKVLGLFTGHIPMVIKNRKG